MSEARRSRRRRANNNSLLIIVLSIVVIVSTIAGAYVSAHRAKTGGSGVERSDEPSITVIEGENKLEKDKYPAVNELIANYRKAFLEGDTQLLKTVYNTDEEINQSILTGTSAVIEEYTNTQCYTKRGINTGEYVAFVYDDLKLSDIKTPAPNLSVFYIKPSDNGSLYIYRGEYNASTGQYSYDADTQSYVDARYLDDDVINLISTVNKKMDSACADDEDLMNFMERLRAQTDDSIVDSAPATAETEAGAQAETQGESQAETQAETQMESIAEEGQV